MRILSALLLCVLVLSGGGAQGAADAVTGGEREQVIRRVLAQPEFDDVDEGTVQSFGGWLLYRVRYWWFNQGSNADFERVQAWLTWPMAILTAGLALVLILLTIRLFARRGEKQYERSPLFGLRSERVRLGDPRRHLKEADVLAERGAFRPAMHEAQLAALAVLERAGIVKSQRARTNWEYLDLARGGLAMNQRDAMAEAFGLFDLKWYGHQDCRPEDYHRMRSLVVSLVEELSHR